MSENLDKGMEYGKAAMPAPKTGLDTAPPASAVRTSGVPDGIITGKNLAQRKIAEHSPFKFDGMESTQGPGGPADTTPTGKSPAIRTAVYKEAVNVNNAPVLPLAPSPAIAPQGDDRGVGKFNVAPHQSKIESHDFHKPPTSNNQPFMTTNADMRGKATIEKGISMAGMDEKKMEGAEERGDEDRFPAEPAQFKEEVRVRETQP